MGPDWGWPVLTGMLWLVVSLTIVWSIVWKGVALWKAGRNGHLVWFVVMFVINTLGILEIIYIFAFSRREHG